MKIPFDIKYRSQIESGEYKVETRNGRPVRIICWDKKSEKKYGYHIVGLIEYGPQQEESTYYTIDGKGRLEDKEPELFIITPEPELSEFEKGYMRIVHKMKPEDFNDEGLKIAKEEAAELLELARNELEPEVLERLEAAYKNQDEVVYENGKRDGKVEALKDLPRWKKCDKNTIYNTKFNLVENGVGRFLMVEGYQIGIDSLEKLPGFKE